MAADLTLKLLEEYYTKDNYTLRDWHLMMIAFVLGEDAAQKLKSKREWGLVMGDIERAVGLKFDKTPLCSCLKSGEKGHPLSPQSADLLVKLNLFAPLPYLKRQMQEKCRREALAGVRIRDWHNPHYRRALRTSATKASMSMKRAWDRFTQNSEFMSNSLMEEVYRLMTLEISKELAKPGGQRVALSEVAERVGRDLAEYFENIYRERRKALQLQA